MSAILSDDRQYRYLLSRQWLGTGTCLFVMLNPSTADETEDDPTIRRCISFAQRERLGRLLVVNLYAYRATKPADLWVSEVDPIGPKNDEYIRAADEDADLTIVAWGANAQVQRAIKVTAMLDHPMALGFTKYGYPRHPLYLKRDAALELVS